MRTLVFIALVVIAAGGYLAYLNDASVQITVYPGTQVVAPVVPALLGAVAIGIGMGLLGTLVSDVRTGIRNLGRRRRNRLAAKLRGLYLTAERERLAGRTGKAQTLYRKITKLDPEHPQAISCLGDLARASGASRDAISMHRLASRLEPDNPHHLRSLVADYQAMEAHESVAQLIESALQDDAADQSLLIPLREARTAMGEWDAAVGAQTRLLKTAMTGLDSHREHARLNGLRFEHALHLQAEGRTAEGRTALAALTRDARDFSPPYMALGELLVREGNIREALEVFQRGFDETRDESFLAPIENLLIVHLEDPRETIRYFSQLAERDPSNPRMRYYLGRIYYRLEMIDDAFHVFTQLDTQVANCPDLTEMVGRIHLRRHDADAALAALGEAGPTPRYACGHCEHTRPRWQSRCGACGQWGTLSPMVSITPITRPPAEPVLEGLTTAELPAPVR